MTPPRAIRWRWFVLPALALAFVAAMASNWTTVGFEVRPEEANGTIHQRFAIPATALRVSFVSTPRGSSVSFDVDREGFEAWRRGHGFRVVPITAERPGAGFTIDREGVVHPDVILTEGVAFQGDGECSYSGCYDTRTRRCYAGFSCR
ncbi:hypothetical protein [Paludisphaera soli]|uniref:hypothetical protein n=1 Tax=Paludisphaera soli TaxID=2712865 RepID=UPI0013EAA148|nr:hypothetical protein [Paludisphaera soli]